MTTVTKFFVLMSLQAADIASTALALTAGAAEANTVGGLSPLIPASLALLIALKIAVSAGVAWVPVRFVWAGVCCWMLCVVVSNLVVARTL